jgi:acetyl esterase/lipase
LSARAPLLLVAGLLLGGCALDARAGASGCPTRQDQQDQAYVEGGDDLQRLDVHQPDGASCDELVPLVVWVHGGAWRGGDKAKDVAGKVAHWNALGWAVASVNYRLSDTDEPEADRLLAPAHDEDAAAAVGWLHRHAAELGVDPGRIALAGHSAGGGIVAALAADPGYLGAVGLAPADLTCAVILDAEGLDIRTAVADQGEYADLYPLIFGTDRAAWDDLSPAAHLGDAAVPPLFVVTRDRPDHQAIVHDFAATARAAGGDATVLELPTFSHGDVSLRIGDLTDDRLTPALDRFLTGCLAT